MPMSFNIVASIVTGLSLQFGWSLNIPVGTEYVSYGFGHSFKATSHSGLSGSG